MIQAQTATAIKTAPPLKQFFYCVSCQMERPVDQLGKIINGNRSKRCKTCCAKADAARALIAKSN